MTYIIVAPCIDLKDASCVDVCPVDCIYEGPDQYYIHPEECIDCGACVPECPVDAIFPDDDDVGHLDLLPPLPPLYTRRRCWTVHPELRRRLFRKTRRYRHAR